MTERSSAHRGTDDADIAGLRADAGFRLRFAFLRVASIAALVYISNVAFNVYDIVTDDSARPAEVGDWIEKLFVVGLPSIFGQLRSLLGSLAGVAIVAFFLALTAPVRYALSKRSYALQLAAFRQKANEELRRDWPDVDIDDTVDIPEYVERKQREDAVERSLHLEQLRAWLARDELLVHRVALEVAKRRLARDLLGTVLVSAGAVIVAGRVIEVLR